MLVKVLVIVGCLSGMMPVYAQAPATDSVQAQAELQQVEKKPDKKEGKGFSVFWLVFIGAILFVVSSATALNSLGGKTPPRTSGGTTAPGKKKTRSDGKERFRL